MRIVFTIIMTLLVAGGLSARQPAQRQLDISSLSLQTLGDSVRIAFTAQAGAKVVRSNQMITVTPVLLSGNQRYELTPIALRGRDSRIAQQRRARAANTVLDDQGVIFMKNASRYHYQASLPVSAFLPGASLVFESDVMICAYEGETVQTIGDNLVEVRTEVIPPVEEPVMIVEELTTGDLIAQDFPFVVPAGAPEGDIREFAMTIYFELNKFDINYNFRDNRNRLNQILSAINLIQRSEDSRVTRVMLAGYASPEGKAERNEMLAQRRGDALREYILVQTGISQDKFVLHNGGADWDGLRKMVEASEMDYRNDVLLLIDSMPVWDAQNNVGRMGRIMKLDGGNVYRYMDKHFFPDLRNAAYIKVYYENK